MGNICGSSKETEKPIAIHKTIINDSQKTATSAEETLKTFFEPCWTKYEAIFLNTIINEYINEGYVSNSQTLFDTIKEEYGDIISSQFLNEIYIRNARNIKVVKSLLYIMADLELNSLHGIELGIVSFALNHNDYEVKDLALQCFEKWKEPRYLQYLSSITIGIKYLDEYLEYIIRKTGERQSSQCI